MNEQTVNNEIVVSVPDGFKVLTGEEVKAWSGRSIDQAVVMRNEELHFVICIEWKKTNFLNKNKSQAEILEQTKKNIKIRNFSFRELAELHQLIAGIDVAGFKYSYKVQDVEQKGEYYLLKHNNILYSIGCLGRSETFEENYHFFEEAIKESAFVKG